MTLKEVFSILHHFSEQKKQLGNGPALEAGETKVATNGASSSLSYISQLEKFAIVVAVYKILCNGVTSQQTTNGSQVFEATKQDVLDTICKADVLPNFAKNKNALARVIREINSHFRFEFVSTNKRNFFVASSQAKAEVTKLENLLNQNAVLSGVSVPECFSVGVDHSLMSYHAWIASRSADFKFNKTIPSQFLLQEGSAEMIYDWYRESQLDAAITRVTDKLSQAEHADLLDSVELQFRLLVNRREANQYDIDSLGWEFLEGKTVLVVDNGAGLTSLCQEKAPATTNVVTTRSWSEAMASVLASQKSVCCIACPETLSSKDRTRFIEIDLPELPKLEVGVYLFKNRIAPNAPSEQDVRKLASNYQEHLKSIAAMDSKLADQLKTLLCHTAHLTLDQDGSPRWVKGDLHNVSVTPNGRIRADHFLDYDSKRTTLDGRVTEGDGKINVCCRFWERSPSEPKGPDGYAVHFTMDKREHEFFVGGWNGTPTFNSHFPFLGGIFVVGAQDFREFSDEELNGLVAKWTQQSGLDDLSAIGKLFWPFPIVSKKQADEEK